MKIRSYPFGLKILVIGTVMTVGFLSLPQMASATSWLWSNPSKSQYSGEVKNGAMIYNKTMTDEQAYRGHQSMQVVNPGGWGSSSDPQSMTVEDMDYLGMVMKRQQDDIKALAEKAANLAKANEKKGGLRAALSRQAIANGITPLGVEPQVQSEKSPRKIPKVPVAEWEKLNQQNQNKAATQP